VRSKPDVAIVGLGLIGGSLARALTAAGRRVFGIDRAPVVRAARRARAIAGGATTIDALPDVRLIVLAAPPRTNRALLRRLARRVALSTVITDLGSVKAPIGTLARELGLSSFVGGHPMAGSERSGFAASRPDLFRDHAWILTPDGAAPRAVAAVRALARAAGARTHVMSAADHDRTVAFISHMPQLASWAIAHAASTDGVVARHLHLAGPGFRDMTRLARSPRPLWRMILSENRAEVARAMAALSSALRRRV
jgi:prephenate dehydrogenase